MKERELTQEQVTSLAMELSTEFNTALGDFVGKHPEATIGVGIVAGRMYLFNILRTAQKRECALCMLAECYDRIKEALEQVPEKLFGTDD